MKKFKEILLKLIFPPVKVIVISSIIGFPMVILSLIYLSAINPVSCISYVISAYALTVLCTNFPKAKRRCHELIHGNEVKIIVSFRNFMNRYKYTSMYLNDKEFRAKFSLYIGFGINCFYVLFKCGTGIMFRSVWLWATGIYYLVIASIRFMLLRNIRITDKSSHSLKRKIHEQKSYRKCGIMMFLLNLAMSGMIIQMIWQNRSYEYKGYIIYISAMYTFYCFISSISNVISFAKRDNAILSATKNLNLAGAVMSMFALQTAMFSAFGNGDRLQKKMNTITGTAVCIIVMCMAVFMIVRADKNLKQLERSVRNGEQ
ncbi:MAG: hypothetical protein K2H28_06705 [Ruminococcus sp.]|nr:hypothetical protein [Ruminococcus sp.]